MPKSYSILVTAISSVTIDKITIGFIKWRLIDEETRRLSNGNASASIYDRSTFRIYSKNSPFKCYGSNYVGHKIFECLKQTGKKNKPWFKKKNKQSNL